MDTYNHYKRERAKIADSLFQTILDLMPVGMAVFDDTPRVIDCNDELVRMFNAPKQQILDHFFDSFSPVFLPDGRPSLPAAYDIMRRAVAGETVRTEWQHQTLGGEPVPCEVLLTQVKNEDYFIGIGFLFDQRGKKEMTDKIYSQNELLKTAVRAAAEAGKQKNKALISLESILNGLDAFVYITVPTTGELLFVNRYMRRAFNREHDSLVGEHCYKLFRGFDRMCDFCPCFSLEEDPNQIIVWDEYLEVLDANLRHSDSYIDWPDGSKVHLQHAVDITEMVKDRVKEISRMNRYTKLLLDATPLCCTLWNKDLQIIDCNQEAMRLFEATDKEAFMRNFLKLAPECQPTGEKSVETAYAAIAQAFVTGSMRSEWMHRTYNGEDLPCEAMLVRVEHGDEYLVAGFSRDLREQKAHMAQMERVQESLRFARDASEAANRAKTMFLANISHEIRTPMNSIIGFSELARDVDLPDKIKGYISNINESAVWLLDIINDILDITKIESGKIAMEHIPFSLSDIVAYCCSSVSPRAAEKGIELRCCAEPLGEGRLLGDPVRLRQVFLNLLTNSVKFTESGAVDFTAVVTQKIDPQQCDCGKVTMLFEVRDTGIGMTEGQMAKVFEPFMQADNTVTRRYGGTGLGLPIAKNIVELMGGTLMLESTYGAGTRISFELTFDYTCGDESDSSPDLIRKNKQRPRFNGEILVCEDNKLNQQVVFDHLDRLGLVVKVAGDGKEGVDIVTERARSGGKPFDLIFMDMHMPEMDGLEAASIISGLGVPTPIVALTANIMTNDIWQYKSSGINDFLGKPFTSQELWKCLMKYIPVAGYTNIDSRNTPEEKDRLKDELRRLFVTSNLHTCEKLADALGCGDFKTAHRIAHTLASSAGQIGKERLREAALAAESLLAGNIPPNEGLLAFLNEELAKTLDELSPLLAEANREVPKIDDTGAMLGILERLEPLLDKRNPACCQMADEVRSVPGAEALAECIGGYKFKAALEELRALRRKIESGAMN